MIKMLYLPLIALMLFFSLIVHSSIPPEQDNIALLYISDYNNVSRDDKFYTVLDIESGKTIQFPRPRGFKDIQYSGEIPPPERVEYTSPHDDSVQFVLLRDYNAPNQEEQEKLYRMRADDQLELVLMGSYISIGLNNFTDDGRYVYLYTKSASDIRYTYYTLYQYDIKSTELQVVAENVQNTYLNCQSDLCLFISGLPDDENTPQTLFVLDKNMGELQEIETANKIFIPRWWSERELLYAYFDGENLATIITYNLETDQYHILAEIEAQGIANLRGISTDNDETAEVLLVMANSLENNSVWDAHIVNNLDSHPRSYPLGIQTRFSFELIHIPSDNTLLLVSVPPEANRENNVFIVNDIPTQPVVEELTNEDFDADIIRDFRSASKLDDTWLIRVTVSNDEWRYYSIHVPTRTIINLATFNTSQWVVQTLFSEDKKWLALSIEEAGKYYVEIVSLDGHQPPQKLDVDTESYVCLLGWYEPDFVPPPCSLYFGMG